MSLNKTIKSKKCLYFIVVNCLIALLLYMGILMWESVLFGGKVVSGAEKMTIFVSESLRLDKNEVIILKKSKKGTVSGGDIDNNIGMIASQSASPENNGVLSQNVSSGDTWTPIGSGVPIRQNVPTENVVQEESSMPTGSIVPEESGMPTGSVVPEESGMPTESVVPEESGMPTESDIPAESYKPTSSPTQLPQNSALISHLISLESGRKLDLSKYIILKGGSSSSRNKAKLVYTVLDVNNGKSKASISKTSGLLNAKKAGKVYVQIQGKLNNGIFDSAIVAVNIVKKSSSANRIKARRLDIVMGRLNLSKKLTKKNIAGYYNTWFSVDKTVRGFSSYNTYRNVNHDGKNNYLGLTNDARYCAVRDRIGKYLYGKSLSIKSIRYISEYEGFIITWNHKIDTLDLVSYAYKNKKKYNKKAVMSVGVVLTATVTSAKNGTDVSGLKSAATAGRRQSIVVKLKKGMRLVQVKPAKSTLQTGMRILEIKSFYRSITRTCRFPMIYQNSKKVVFPKRVIAVRNATNGGSAIAYTNVYRSYRCVQVGSNGWYRIRLGAGKIGYVRKRDMSASQPKAYSAVSVSKKVYGYKDMKKDIDVLKNRYPQLLSVSVLAKTVDKNNIYCIRMGNANAPHKVVIQSTMHAREWLNIQFMMANIEYYCKNYYSAEYKEVSFSKLFKNVCFYIVPLSNPDGASISQYGLKGLKSKKLRKYVKKIGAGQYKRWKANARGVDINRNFSYGFGLVKSSVNKPSPMYYAGKKAFSERESRALKKLIDNVKPEIVLNYHQVGEVIYHDTDSELLNIVQKLTGYMPIAESTAGDGSMGSWLTHNKIQWCTIETGVGVAPVSHKQFKDVWKQNKNIVAAVANLLMDEEED